MQGDPQYHIIPGRTQAVSPVANTRPSHWGRCRIEEGGRGGPPGQSSDVVGKAAQPPLGHREALAAEAARMGLKTGRIRPMKQWPTNGSTGRQQLAPTQSLLTLPSGVW
mmetsp:Transcript_64669/g.107146  ORF Transcript_64669/g.107146 Transcript_64669/m.107146 type:complete len:109 (+) Transcript_64669:2145-2471(+)